jgi:hypothetical protein
MRLAWRSSPRHFQQDLAATEEMLHRVLDVLQGVHARRGDNEGAVGHQWRSIGQTRLMLRLGNLPTTRTTAGPEPNYTRRLAAQRE